MVLSYSLTYNYPFFSLFLPLLLRLHIVHLYYVFYVTSWSHMPSADFITIYDLHFRISCSIVFFLVVCKWFCLVPIKHANISPSSFVHYVWCLKISLNTSAHTHWSHGYVQQFPLISSFWESREMLRVVQNNLLCPPLCVHMMRSDRTAQKSQVTESFISIARLVSDNECGHTAWEWELPLYSTLWPRKNVYITKVFHT